MNVKFTSLQRLVLSVSIYLSLATASAMAQTVANFDGLTSKLDGGSYWNGLGATAYSSFLSGGTEFPIAYSTAYGGYWTAGWAYSNVQNTTLSGRANLYAAYPGSGSDGSANYAVGQQNAVVKLSATATINGLQVANGTYAVLSMKNGDSFGKKFGGSTGTDPDFFKLSIYGYSNGILNTTTGVDVYLADFTSSISGEDFILDSWKTVGLQTLGAVDSLLFSLSSSDVGQFGINTPLFFCVDNVSVSGGNVADFENFSLNANSYFNKPETTIHTGFSEGGAYFYTDYNLSSWGDYATGFYLSNVNNTTLAGYTNPYAAITGMGYGAEGIYAVNYNDNKLTLADAATVSGFYFTNTTYAYLSMKDGDSFAKKFGGSSGNDADYFKITIQGYLNNVTTAGAIDVYLADFRDSDNNNDYIVNTWKWADLSTLGKVDKLTFTFASSDAGQYGINTPTYFAMDNFTLAAEPVTAIAEGKTKGSIAVYPNPAADVLYVESEGTVGEVSIYGLDGTKVLTATVQGKGVLSVAALPQGVYVLKTAGENGVAVAKFVKE